MGEEFDKSLNKELEKKIKRIIKISKKKNNKKLKEAIIKEFPDYLTYRDEDNNTLLHIFSSKSEQRNISYILIKLGLDVNAVNNNGDNFIQNIIRVNPSYNAIIILFDYVNDKLNVNHQNNNGDTIMHLILKDRIFYGNWLLHVYKKLKELNFNINIKNNDGNTILDLINNYENLSKAIEELKKKIQQDYFDEEYFNTFKKNDNNEENSVLEFFNNFGEIYTDREYKENPSVKYGHETLYLVTILINNKIPIFVEKELSGKFLLLDTLSYKIQNNFYSFLKDSKLFVTSADDIIKGCKLISEFKINLYRIIKYCALNNYVLFIKDIDEIYNNSYSLEEKEEIEIYINYYINEYKLKLIGHLKQDKKDIFTSVLYSKIDNIYLENYKDDYFKIIDNMINKIKEKSGHHLLDREIKLIRNILYTVANKENIANNDTTTVIRVIEDLFNVLFGGKYLYLYNDETIKNYINSYELITEKCKIKLLDLIDDEKKERLDMKKIKKL